MTRVKLPKKFQKTNRSFINILQTVRVGGVFPSFCGFPEDIGFKGKETEETVVLLVRRSLASLIPNALMIFFFFIFPFIFMVLSNSIGLESIVRLLNIGVWLISWAITLGLIIDTFLKWYFTVNVITDQRIIDIDFKSVLYHNYSESQLEKVEDVTHVVAGLGSSIFDYGSVYVQTAASKNEIELLFIPKPREVQDVIVDLLEMKQKGEI